MHLEPSSLLRLGVGLAFALLLAARGWAQLVPDGGTTILDGVTTNVAAPNNIGSNAPNSLLVITNGGVLGNDLAVIGVNSASSNNVVIVTGIGSRWTNGGALTVGRRGAFNRLEVSGGAVLASASASVGAFIGGNHNLVQIVDPDSLWTNTGALIVGQVGSFNRLAVSNSGTVHVGGIVTLGNGVNATNNSAEVRGGSIVSAGLVLGNAGSRNNSVTLLSNSTWNLGGGTFAWGNAGSGNTLAIDATSSLRGIGSLTLDENATLFRFTNGPGGFAFNDFTTNQLQFRDSGLSTLLVGNGGTNVQLLISNYALATTNGVLGAAAGALGNAVTVAGAGTLWTNNAALLIGSNGSFNTLTVSDGGTVRNFQTTVGLGAGASSNALVVTGAGTLWSNSFSVTVGDAGTGNRLVVSNGARMVSFTGLLGGADTAGDNTAHVTGAGSVWTNNYGLTLGGAGAGNRLVVDNGGVVANTAGTLGAAITGSHNLALITGAGSRWDNFGDLQIGVAGSSNQMTVSNGAVVNSADGRLGVESWSAGNTALVTGAGSVWSNRGALLIGSNGSFNTLVLSNGGTVSATNAFVGFGESSSNNLLVVQGGTLTVTNAAGTGTLDIRRGTNVLNAGLIEADRLVMTNGAGFFEFNGGTLITRGGIISNGRGFVVGASGAIAAIMDVRTNVPLTLNNGFTLGANTAAAGNQLLITNGGTLNVLGTSYLSTTATASNNLAVISGPGSLWTNSGGLYVGNSGSGNQLVVSNGGTVASTDGHIGYGGFFNPSLGNNNLAVVTGAGSLWTNSGELSVGDSGSGNQMVVRNGGVVANGNGVLGLRSTASNNVALVTGAGSRWNNSGDLVVGVVGNGNQMVVSDGGVVANGTGTIGANWGATKNMAVVMGAGSLWTNSGSLRVGGTGSGNQLVVSNGGVVANGTGFLGAGLGASSNLALVTGAGSRWTNSGSLLVGYLGSGNEVMVTDGGIVSASNVTMGFTVNSTNNRVTVDGGTLRVTNAAGTGALDIRRGTNVLNAGLIEADRLVMTSTNGFFDFNGGTLITRGATIANDPFLVGNTGVTPAIWDVRSGSIGHTISTYLIVGQNVPGSQLLITNGGRLDVTGADSDQTSTSLGATVAASNALAVVAGAGSVFSSALDLNVGSNAAFNTLIVSNGGVVQDRTGLIGYQAVSSNNIALVTGVGSGWSNSYDLFVGYSGSFNSLRITNGGVVVNRNSAIGNFSGAFHNTVAVDGPGSAWVTTGTMLVGNLGNFNALRVTGGAFLTNATAYVGCYGDTTFATVSGEGSVWGSSGILHVGYGSATNTLLVKDGASVRSAGGYVGVDGGDYNTVIVSDPGSAWDSLGDLFIGSSGSHNRLLITNGGRVSSFNNSFGGRSNNMIMVDGPGSVWNSSGYLMVGSLGSYNTLLITGGGTVSNTFGFLGVSSLASNNSVVVSGTNSAWNNSGTVNVGYDGSFHTLLVGDGGAVTAGEGVFVGLNPGSLGNRLTVNGGTVRATNAAGIGALDIRRGTNVLNAGLIEADRLVMTNDAGFFDFNGGTLSVRSATVSNGVPFTVGNGTSNAVFNLLGNGTHSFSNTLVIASNATLTGNGTITATVTNFGTIAPGSSAGSIRILGDLTLAASATMSFEIGGLIATNQYDRVDVTNFVQFAGTLSLALLNGFVPAPADTFTLMTFGASGGAFANAPTNGAVIQTADLVRKFTVGYTATSLVLSNAQPGDAPLFTSIIPAAGSVTVRFEAAATNTYEVQYSGDLTNWLAVTNAVLTHPAPDVTEWIDDGTLTGGFTPVRVYRVRRVP